MKQYVQSQFVICNQGVTGSSPVAGTSKIKELSAKITINNETRFGAG